MTHTNDRRRIQRWHVAVALLVLLGPAGCGSRGVTLVRVSGTVTFDGEPVKTGEILFRAADGAVPSHAGPIVAGRYQARVSPGTKRVEIIATRPPAKVVENPSGSGEPTPVEMYVPDHYNARSMLTADVTAAGPNVFDFQLTGTEPRR
jgi:hypothetical protein